MHSCPQHTFQILTKRSERLRHLGATLNWTPNIWMGVSVENDRTVNRINDLAHVPAKIRFLSCEPLLGPLEHLPLRRIHWVIVGGESGPGARSMAPEWVESIHRQCRLACVPFFFKQWGGVRKDMTGRELHGRTYDEMPRTEPDPEECRPNELVQIAAL
jgi:protein gp37